MRVGFLQFCPIRENVRHNLDIIQHFVNEQKYDLLVLPELANSGYCYEDPTDLAPLCESIQEPGNFLRGLLDLALENDVCIVSGFAEAADGKLYNSAVAVSKDGILACYRKTHLYNTEKALFSAGDTGFQVFSLKQVKIGVMICFDWIFPESARTLALKGAQVIAHPANLVLPYCQAAMSTRSLENGVYTITANRVGSEIMNVSMLTFTGNSQVTGTRGEILCRADADCECIKAAEINPEEATIKTISPNNDLFADRRDVLHLKS